MSRQRWGERIPHIRRTDDGRDGWFIDGKPFFKYGQPYLASVQGVMKDRTSPTRWEDVPEITYVPAQRVKEMDRDGVDVHTFFGNVSGIAGNTFSNPAYPDAEFREECIRAYNDYQIDELAKPYPGRFIPLAQVPMWDAERAVAEARRMAERGAKGITFAFPHQFGYPHVSDRCWDPLWAFAGEANLPICFHIGSGAAMGIAMESLSGIMQRFPELKIVSSESGAGWVPYVLEVADHHWDHAGCAKDGMPLPPSEYFRRQCYVTFWFEAAGLKILRDHVGLDNVMFGSDFPHPTGTWPSTRACIERSLEGLTDGERRKLMVDNAVRVFGL
jgi:predicted TIM-barrel fold metal-dependent hydrolase